MQNPLKTLCGAALLLAVGLGSVRADEALRKAQQALRELGFYYGTVDGSPGDETTQAIRRYQIRNGLAVTGQLNDETQKSIAKTGSAPSSKPSDGSRPAPQPTVPPPLEPPASAPPPATIRGNDDENEQPAPPPPPRVAPRNDLRVAPAERPPVNVVRPSAELTRIFSDTPYEFAPPPVQADVLRRVQISLSRSGFFGGEPDGVPGGKTTDAIAEFQSAYDLRRTGRLDVNTLAALRLLPGRRIGPPPVRGNPPVFEGRIVR